MLAHTVNQADTIHMRHIEVGDDHVHLLALQLGKSVPAVLGLNHPLTALLSVKESIILILAESSTARMVLCISLLLPEGVSTLVLTVIFGNKTCRAGRLVKGG